MVSRIMRNFAVKYILTMKNDTKRHGPHYGYVIVMCCCLIMGIDVGLVMSCAGIFYRPVTTDLGFSVGSFGLYMSFMFASSTLMLPLSGRMLRRGSARRIFSINSALLGAVVMSMALYGSVWQFYAAGVAMGITLAPLLYLSFPLLVNRWFVTRVGFFMGICSAASGIGGILFNPVGGAIIDAWGWRAGYLVFGGIILLIVTPILALLLRDTPADKGLKPYGADSRRAEAAAGDVTGDDAVAPDSGMTYAEARRSPAFYGLIIFAFLMMAVSTLNPFIPTYINGLGHSLGEAAVVAAAVMAGVTAGKILLGLINDRSTAAGSLCTTLCGIGGLLILVVFHDAGTVVASAGAFLFGWAYAGVTVQTPLLVRRVFGSRDYARIYSVVSVALAAGGALTSGGWGVLADATSFAAIFITGMSMLAVALVLALLALRTAHPRA